MKCRTTDCENEVIGKLRYCSPICRSAFRRKTRVKLENGKKPKIFKFHKFYSSRAWLELRYQAFKKYGRKCMICKSDSELHVDHIKSRKYNPQLALNIENLQILCRECNKGKGAKDDTDWRGR